MTSGLKFGSVTNELKAATVSRGRKSGSWFFKRAKMFPGLCVYMKFFFAVCQTFATSEGPCLLLMPQSLQRACMQNTTAGGGTLKSSISLTIRKFAEHSLRLFNADSKAGCASFLTVIAAISTGSVPPSHAMPQSPRVLPSAMTRSPCMSL